MIIAIDGWSGCGKSTLAKDIANALDYDHIDSGAMYRAVTLFLLEHHIDPNNEASVVQVLPNIDITFEGQRIILNGQDVSDVIRSPEVAAWVSPVARISPVRKKLVKLQQSYGKDGNIVMDGRDIASVVFPDADLKFFVTASMEERVHRRHLELKEKGQYLSKAEVEKNLRQRDHIDSSRDDSPLIQVEDALVIDTTRLSRQGQLELALRLIAKMKKGQSKN